MRRYTKSIIKPTRTSKLLYQEQCRKCRKKREKGRRLSQTAGLRANKAVIALALKKRLWPFARISAKRVNLQ